MVIATLLWEATAKSFDFSRCYTEDWVERLYDGFKRNLTTPFEFVCFVDRKRDFKRPVTQYLLKQPIDYGSCIAPYQLDRPMILVGLDTVVTGNCDALAQYCLTGKKLLLPRDPFFPDKACNGVALVPAGHRFIYDQWSGENDMDWVRAQPHELIEQHFPGQVESYKGKVRDHGLGDARIVYFHGLQKPHELDLPWIREHWGGPVPITFQDGLNNDPLTMLGQFKENLKLDLPWFSERKAGNNAAIIVGGGPSLADNLTQLRFRISRGGEVFALNGTHDYLIDRGIVPDYMVMLDSRKDNVRFVERPHKRVKYLISAFCHPDVFEALKGFDVTLWMSDMDGVIPLVKDIHDKPVCLVGGGATVGMKTMFLTYLMGFKKFHFFGFDSSYRGEDNHAYRQPMNDTERRVEIMAAGKKFTCAPWMAKQAMEFQSQARQLIDLGCKLTVHGDGLIPWIMQNWRNDVRTGNSSRQR